MYYNFNNFTGRLIGNHGTPTPYYPLSATPANHSPSPKIVFESSKVKIVQESAPRRMSSKTVPGTNIPMGEVTAAMKAKMERFQLADGVPVHLKGGPMDRILYGITLGLCFVGVGLTLHTVYLLAYPQKNK